MDDPHRPTPPTDGDLDVPYTELSRTLRELARQLVGDPERADDLVQEAWVAALDRRPEEVRDLTAWLRQVVRNLARRSYRRRLRRRDAEALAGAAEAVESEERLIEQANTYRMLREATDELDEPWRSVVVARFFEGRSVAAIMAETGRSETTVRRQIARGLEGLRGALDRRHRGQRSLWSALLARFAGEDAGSGTPGPTGTELASEVTGTGQGALWIVAAAAVVPLLAWLVPELFGRSTLEADSVEISAALATPGSAPAELPEGSLRVAAAAPAVLEENPLAEASAPSQPMVEAPGRRTLELTVLRSDGSPAVQPEVRVRVPGTEDTFIGDERGRVHISYPPERLFDDLPGFETGELGLHLRARSEGEAWSYRLVVPVPEEGAVAEVSTRGPCFDLHGLVVDGDDHPVPGATVQIVEGGLHVSAHTEEGLMFTSAMLPFETDGEGRFRLTSLVRKPLAVTIGAPDLATLEQVVEPEVASTESNPVLESRFVLRSGLSLHGRIRLESGGPAAGARVWVPDLVKELAGIAPATAHCDDQGLYVLEGLRAGEQSVCATLPERPELFAWNVVQVRDGVAETWDAVLAPTEGVRFRVEDAEGTPVDDAFVVLAREQPNWGHHLYTTPDGRAHFRHVPDGELVVHVSSRFDLTPTTFPVDRSEPESVLRLPIAVPGGLIEGALADELGLLALGARVVGTSEATDFVADVDSKSGRFALTVDAGVYELAAIVEGLGAAWLGSFEVPAGGTQDVGVLALPVPQVVDLSWSSDAGGAGWVLSIELDGRPGGQALMPLDDSLESLELLPGRYRLAREGARPTAGVRFEVPAGGEASILVEVR